MYTYSIATTSWPHIICESLCPRNCVPILRSRPMRHPTIILPAQCCNLFHGCGITPECTFLYSPKVEYSKQFGPMALDTCLEHYPTNCAQLISPDSVFARIKNSREKFSNFYGNWQMSACCWGSGWSSHTLPDCIH
jgi:hypothetical protein